MYDKALPYEWAKGLSFSTRGNALPYCISGWAEPELGLIWTDGLNARLSFTVLPPTSDVSLVISCFPYLGEGKIPFQEMHIFVNFLRVGFTVLKAPSEIDISIPKHVFGQPKVNIDLYLPKAASPASLGLSNDLRELGVAVNRLMLAAS
jgi:hypothetical protein